ncbi:hypothetical protein MMC08_006041 [Hypocenomyce scalaris]|nr:hypothetical protein [Hypocenomyce scalaris]
MATAPGSISPASREESSAPQQARLRRERREAKLKAGGSARLEKITQLSGRPAEPMPPLTAGLPSPPTSNTSPAGGNLHLDDPEEVDISRHPYTSSRSPRPGARFDDNATTAAEMRQMLVGGGGAQPHMQDNPFAVPGMGVFPGQTQASSPMGPGGSGEDDPMMRMLQQMMGGGMPPGGAAGEGGLPPGLAAMLGGGPGGGAGMAAPLTEAPGAHWWKIAHAVFALMLGVYMTSMTTFSGSRLSRAGFAEGDLGVRFFWVFATAELVLQSSRFFMERGRLASQGGVLGMIGGVLPEPYKGYVALIRRYSGIYTTVVEDAMVVVFVLGLKAWWKGGVMSMG